MSNSVIDAFKGLNVASARDVSDHEAIFEVSYQFLLKIKQFRDLASFHNCLVSLINTDKYYKALELIREVPAEIHQEHPLEKAYVYYKTGNTTLLEEVYDSTKAATGVSDSLMRALKHVMAQSCYQGGQIERALALYHELISSNSIDNESDIACNERAILSQLALKTGHTCEEPTLHLDAAKQTYDYIFNDALIALAQGKSEQSLQLLETALSLCARQNADMDAADLALEVAPIKLTIAYIYQVNGETQRAVEILDSVNTEEMSDLMVQLILKTNYSSLVPGNVNLTERALNYQYNLQHLRQKLTKAQSQVFLKNHLLLSYQTSTISKSSSYVSHAFFAKYAQDYPGDFTPLVYRILVKLDISLDDLDTSSKAVGRKVFKYVHEELEKGEVSDSVLAAALLLVAVNSRTSKYDQAILVMEKVVALELAGSRVHASVVGTLIHLYELYNNSKKLTELYTALVKEFESTGVQKDGFLYDFVRAVAFKLLNVNIVESATKLFELLGAADPSDAVVASVLNSSSAGLVPVDNLASEADVDELLAVNVESLVAPSPAVGVAKLRVRSDFKVKKKTSKPKFSQHKFYKPVHEFDGKDLDQERWLPMKLRSYYKPSKKELKKKGHQGAVEASPAPSATPTPASKSKSKKKKKGKK